MGGGGWGRSEAKMREGGLQPGCPRGWESEGSAVGGQVDASGVVGSHYGQKATGPCADDQSAGGMDTASDCPSLEDEMSESEGGEGENQAGGEATGEAGSGKGELPCKPEQQQQQQDAAPPHLPEDLRDGKGVCVMCTGGGADILCKYCGWPLHRATCALPARDPLLQGGPHPMEGEKEACVDCLCRVQAPGCVSRYAAC